MADFGVYNNIQRTFPRPPVTMPKEEKDPASGGFGDLLKDAINEVNKLDVESSGQLDKFLDDKTDLHSVMMALERADLSFQVMMQVRNKIVTAYQEIMKTQV
jgi:flagellar hook-basal body complex protein FliE